MPRCWSYRRRCRLLVGWTRQTRQCNSAERSLLCSAVNNNNTVCKTKLLHLKVRVWLRMGWKFPQLIYTSRSYFFYLHHYFFGFT